MPVLNCLVQVYFRGLQFVTLAFGNNIINLCLIGDYNKIQKVKPFLLTSNDSEVLKYNFQCFLLCHNCFVPSHVLTVLKSGLLWNEVSALPTLVISFNVDSSTSILFTFMSSLTWMTIHYLLQFLALLHTFCFLCTGYLSYPFFALSLWWTSGLLTLYLQTD